jgi:hypothetical protein
MDLKDAIQSVCQKATNSRAYDFAAVSLVDAKPVSIANRKFHVTKSDATTYKADLVDGTGAVLAPCDLGKAYALAGAITNIAFSTSTYGQVKLDPIFALLYDVANRNVSYVSAGTSGIKNEQTVPCMICGVVLPIRNMTIDHQRPQTGGDYEAIVKTFRAFGLTQEGPKGDKGKKILAHLTSGAAISAVQTQPGRAPLGGTSVNARYTLNESGVLLYSFVCESGKLDQLKIACMHGLMNLQPACNSCNSSRGQQLKF